MGFHLEPVTPDLVGLVFLSSLSILFGLLVVLWGLEMAKLTPYHGTNHHSLDLLFCLVFGFMVLFMSSVLGYVGFLGLRYNLLMLSCRFR